jgi:5-methylthioadenosine/S-adenosylhomocysteine deaminase
MDDILIKNVLLFGKKANVLIKGNRFSSVDAPADAQARQVIDGEGMAILPPFYNTHTHAAMSLLRGYADDMPLQKWLTEYIWPFEEKMTAADIREGSRIAVREMIKSGTVFFSDMYFDIEETIDLVNEYGMRAAIGVTFMESHSKSQQDDKLDLLKHWTDPTGGRVTLTVAPHAIYTVGPDLLKRCSRSARDLGLKLHIHISETRKEVDDCLREHGTTPVRYLDQLGVLGPEVVAAHVVHADTEELALLAKRGVTIAHCPCSNLKLSSGIFPYKQAKEAGCRVTLGTDGDSSNNNLDMREEMKFAALIAKCSSGDPETMPAHEALEIATRNGAEAFGIDAGVIAAGKLADAILIRLDDERMQPLHHLVSNWVYAAGSDIVDTVICDGRILMQHRQFPND